MSLLTSLYSGASGLDASSTDLSVIGDNIANANTIGFKASRAAFEEALAQNLLGSSANQVGLGTRLQAVQKIMTQGALSNTGIATDLAVDGGGFFAVKGTQSGVAGQFYTRAGQFTLDQNGYLVNLGGLRVQGYLADSAGQVQPALGDLPVGDLAAPPLPTANITVKANLQSDAEILVNPFDAADPDSTSNFSSSATVYDSLGKAHQVGLYYRKTASGSWEFHGSPMEVESAEESPAPSSRSPPAPSPSIPAASSPPCLSPRTSIRWTRPIPRL
jgi:flagellar hook protein FlgE